MLSARPGAAEPVVGQAAWSTRIRDRVGVQPSTGRDEPYLDGLRALAVLAVIVVHAHAHTGRPALRVFGFDLTFIALTGTFGVPLFFLLSGFLLARPWFRAELFGTAVPRLRTFWWRRFLRLAPAYYLSIAVTLLVFVPSPIHPSNLHGELGLANVVGHLTFVQHMVPLAKGHFAGVGGVYWTLTIEALFYLVLPFVIPLFTGRRWRITIPAAAVVTGLWVYLAQERLGRLVQLMVDNATTADPARSTVASSVEAMRALLGMQLPNYALTFALGIGLARLVVVRDLRQQVGSSSPSWWQRPRTGAIALAVGLGALVVAQHQVGGIMLRPESASITRNIVLNLLPTMALATIVYGFTVGSAGLRRPLEVLPLRYLGWTSYGVYLYHVPVILFLVLHAPLDRLSGATRFVVLLGVTLVLSEVVATASWLAVERPLLRWRPARIGRQALVPAGAALLCLLVVGWAATRPAPADAVAAGFPGRDHPHLLAFPLGEGIVQEQATGDATLDEAMARGVLYPIQQNLLASCGPVDASGVAGPATQVTTLVLVAPDWTVLGSAAACADGGRADSAVSALVDWRRSVGATVWEDDGRPSWPRPPGAVLQWEEEITPGYPVQVHVFYRSASRVVALLLQARSLEAGHDAVTTLLDATAFNYPGS